MKTEKNKMNKNRKLQTAINKLINLMPSNKNYCTTVLQILSSCQYHHLKMMALYATQLQGIYNLQHKNERLTFLSNVRKKCPQSK